MLRRALTVSILFAVLSLSGCFAAHKTMESGSSAASSSNSINTSIPLTMEFSGCTSFDAFVAIPRALAQGKTPDGWEPKDPTNPLADYGVQGYLCQKFSLGPFERGPIVFIADMHDVADFPIACVQSAGRGDALVLNVLFVSDPDVAGFLNRTYNMPVMVANVQQSNDTYGPGTLHTLTWTPVGGQSTTLHVIDDGTAVAAPPYHLIMLWQDQHRIISLRLDTPRLEPIFTNRFASGTFSPPSVFANWMNGNFSGIGDWYASADGTGTFTRYNDLVCTPPK